jgi:exodeoxyribonuclease VII small subunit
MVLKNATTHHRSLTTDHQFSRSPMKKQHDFESALQRLDAIVKTMEEGDLPLAAALELFEEGVNLSQFCHTKLDEAERKVEILVKKPDGMLETAPFEIDKNQD